MKDDAKIMANLLKTGHTMLNISCPICKNPIFQDKNNKKFCPICSREVIVVENTEDKSENSTHQFNKEQVGKKLEKQEKKKDFTFLKDVIIKKIEMLYIKLTDEDQIDLIEKYSEILLKLLKIMTYLEQFKEDREP